jgi:hypothetical protein
MSKHRAALQNAVACCTGTVGAAYVDDDGSVQVVGNTNELELADLFERAAGVLRARVDPSATTLD